MSVRSCVQKANTSFIVSVDLVADLVTFSPSVTKLSDIDGCTITSKAVTLLTLNLGSGFPFSLEHILYSLNASVKHINVFHSTHSLSNNWITIIIDRREVFRTSFSI